MTNKKNILIISPFFYPEPISTGKFNTDVAVALAREGHEVTVLCFHPFYPDWKTKTSHQQLKNIKIVRGGKHLKFTNKTIFRRLILEFSFAFFVLRKLYKHQKNKNLVIPIFPPSFAFYFMLPFLNKKIKKVGMVHDLQEIYSKGKTGFLNKVISFFIHHIEKKCYQNCHQLLFLSGEMKNEAQKLYQLEASKLQVQYPFHSIENVITNDLSDVLKEEHINIVYSGALGEKQNPYVLYDFFEFASQKTENTIFHFFSQGAIYEDLKEKNSNNKIKFHELVPRKNLEELYFKSDLQIIPQLPNTSKGSLPSKLPNLLASGCKVLIITDKKSEIQSLFKAYNLEKVTTSWDFDLLFNEVKSCLNNTASTKHQVDVALKLFTINEMIEKVLI